MCTGQEPASVTEALAAVRAGLDFLNRVPAADLPGPVQADCLRGLARVEAAHTAAQARMLAAFAAAGSQEADGQQSARAWLKWQTQVTHGAAAGAVGWARRLAAYPALAEALAAGTVSPSWARQIAAWADLLPGEDRAAAVDILLAAATTSGVTLPDLAGLAEEIRRRTATPDSDAGDGGFGERQVRLGITLGGAGRLDGDLTPACAAALTAVLASLAAKAGPEDTRTPGQRRHDALEEACRRLTAAGGLPGRADQPTHIQLHLTLDQLRNLPGAAGPEAAWAAGHGQPGWLTGRAAQGYACDAAISPVVAGHVDHTALAALADRLSPACRCGRCTCRPRPAASPAATARLHATLLRHAADVLSGPAGLAAFLRSRLLGGYPAVSLPLDSGAATPTVPGHLRRAVMARHPHCAFPGCDQPSAACHIHHLQPRSQGGPTALGNLVPACAFHHLIAIHHWGWTLTLHPDGTTSATSPDHHRTLHSHGPPRDAA